MLAVLRLFEGSYKFDLFQTLRNNTQPHATGCANRGNVNIKQYWELLATMLRPFSQGLSYSS